MKQVKISLQFSLSKLKTLKHSLKYYQKKLDIDTDGYAETMEDINYILNNISKEESRREEDILQYIQQKDDWWKLKNK